MATEGRPEMGYHDLAPIVLGLRGRRPARCGGANAASRGHLQLLINSYHNRELSGITWGELLTLFSITKGCFFLSKSYVFKKKGIFERNATHLKPLRCIGLNFLVDAYRLIYGEGLSITAQI